MNDKIIDQFNLLIKQVKFDINMTSGKQQMVNMYRLQSIQKVVKILKKFPSKITSSEQLKGIKNIGKSSLQRIDEILKTGKLSEIKISEHIEQDLDIISKLEDIFGIGKKRAFELFKDHNVRSIEDLKIKYENGEIDLPENVVKGLKYVGEIKENIPRSEVDLLNDILVNTTLEIDPALFGVVCGSYRRQLPTSNDVDFIITHPKLKTESDVKKINYIKLLVDKLKHKHIIIDSLTGENVPTKYMGLCRLDNSHPIRRLDIRYIPYESFYSAILYFTGAKDLNRKMRQLASDMDYTLNEYGLFDEKNKMIHVSSEKDIFNLLGMEYLSPDKRN